MHSIYSDGIQTPSEVIKLAAKNKVRYLSLTDHDSVSGIPEAIEAAKQYHIHVFPGIELSVHTKEEEVHLLAYNFNWQDHNWNQLLKSLRDDRENRLQNMVMNLNKMGVEVSSEDVKFFIEEGGAAGRPHVAKALVKKGYVKTP